MGFTSPYTCQKLNESTHLIIHNDKYLEQPFIYVKICPDARCVVVIDTGCGARNSEDGKSALELKDFIQTQIQQIDNSEYHFVVICTHCHFDHIGCIEAFAKAGATIFRSGHDKSFSSLFIMRSVCARLPSYEITYFSGDGEWLSHDGLYDKDEKWLSVGDACYQGAPINIMTPGGQEDNSATVIKLRCFVRDVEDSKETQTVHLASGHNSPSALATPFLQDLSEILERVSEGLVPILVTLPGDQIIPGGLLGKETFVVWHDDRGSHFSLLAPESAQRDSWGLSPLTQPDDRSCD